MSTRLNMEYGKYDNQLWDNVAKKDVYAAWDPNQPRSPMNFNPFETWEGKFSLVKRSPVFETANRVLPGSYPLCSLTIEGNSPDASGYYPGEGRYKDPMRPDVNFQIMMDERKEAEERAANPKPGDVVGAPGCRNKAAAW